MTVQSNTFNSLSNLNLDKVVKTYEDLAKNYPVINKVAILANHIIQLLPKIAIMQILPFSPLTNCAVMVGGSLFYRVTSERLCTLHYSLTSCFGALAFEFAKANSFGLAGSIPLAAYAITVANIAYQSSFTVKACRM